MTDDTYEQLMDGRAWAKFCDDLKAAGQLIQNSPASEDPLAKAEGYRYLTRLLRLAIEENIEFSDSTFPEFHSLSHQTAKIGNDNPDNFYQNCAIDGSKDYLITGHRGTVAYVSIETKAGSFGTSGTMEPTGHVNIDDLDVDENGYFELVVSVNPAEGNYLPMQADSNSVLVRQTFNNRAQETPASLTIRCVTPDKEAVLDPHTFAKNLASVAPFVTGTSTLFEQWMTLFREHVNALPPNDQEMCQRAGGDAAIYYHNSSWALEPDEALLIHFQPPKQCLSWNFQVSNDWMESLDYRYYRICVNRHNAAYENDGTVKIVVTEKDPGDQWPNWLSTAGHTSGAMLLRYIGAEDKPPVFTRVVKRNALDACGDLIDD